MGRNRKISSFGQGQGDKKVEQMNMVGSNQNVSRLCGLTPGAPLRGQIRRRARIGNCQGQIHENVRIVVTWLMRM